MMLPGTPLRDVPTSVQDAELREALGRLEAYEGSAPEVTGFLQKLQDWRNLDSGGRSALLQEVHAFIDNQQKTDRAITFLDRTVGSYPQHLGWGALVLSDNASGLDARARGWLPLISCSGRRRRRNRTVSLWKREDREKGPNSPWYYCPGLVFVGAPK
jgi:hypothetical protein